MKQRKEMIKFGVCIALLFTLNVLSSFCKPQMGADNESYLDFEILDEQSKTCRLKKCVLQKDKVVEVPETAVISGQTYRLTTIGDRSFANYGCQKHLLKVILPQTITTIEESAFYSCDSLKEIVFPPKLTTIYRWAFYDCDGLEEISIPNSVTKIGNAAFSHCDKLTTVTLPNSEVEIEESAFWMTPLSQIFVPQFVKAIGVNAFDCNIIVDNENLNFSSEDGVLFDKTKKKLLSVPVDRESYVIPGSVEIIGDGAFFCCRHLSQVTIPKHLKTIGDCAFESSNIKEVEIPKSVTSIGKKAFLNCWQLSEVVIPNSVEVIGDSAFWQCNSLTQVTLSNSLKEIRCASFELCGRLTQIEIPNSVTVIGKGAFAKTGLTHISIPESTVKIGDWAFFSCYNLSQVTVSDSLLEIGNCAFKYCENLKQITIPSSTKTVGDWVFPQNCEVVGK